MESKDILIKYKNGDISLEEAEAFFRKEPFIDMGFAKLDTHRKIRSGFGEVVFCSGKEDEFLLEIFKKIYETEESVMGTRARLNQYELIKKVFPNAEYKKTAGIIILQSENKKKILSDKINKNKGYIAVCTAGTADIPVAEEAAVTAEYLGCRVERIYDVGVSGIHRLFDNIDKIQAANCVITVAGMEGALASVVGGLVDKPVITVPTSVGYGASFNGLAALLTMLNSCANGVATVNIDNGYGAGYMAAQINKIINP